MNCGFDFDKLKFIFGEDPKLTVKLLNTIFESFDQIRKINYTKFCPKRKETDPDVNVVMIADSYDFINVRYNDKTVYDENLGKSVYKIEIRRYKPLGDKDGATIKNYNISALGKEYIDDVKKAN